VALKNLIGCMVGLENKQKVHSSLFKNIIKLNQYLKPDLHIVDGLICMEGTGPSMGTPLKMDIVLIGRNPYVLDLVCAELAGLDFLRLPVLRKAYKQKLFSDEHINYVKSLNLAIYRKNFREPKVNLLAKFVNHQKWQKYFIKLRLSPFFNFLCAQDIVGRLLNKTALRQDVFIMGDDKIENLSLNQRCDRCGLCANYCPLSLSLPDEIGDCNKGCLLCLYCYFICPKNAIATKGDLGFLNEQIRQYDTLIRNFEKV
jgi:ferredoxin